MGKDGEGVNETPTMLKWLSSNMHNQELEIKRVVDSWIKNGDNNVAKWCIATKGIGPMLTAGLISYFNIEGKQYAGQFWNYAGLNDNNIAWLGRERTTAVLKEMSIQIKNLCDIRLEKTHFMDNKKYVDAVKNFVNKTSRNEFIDILNNLDNVPESYYDERLNKKLRSIEFAKYFISDINALKSENSPGCIEMLYLIDYVCDSEYLNDEHIDILMKLTNRNRTTLIKGCTNENGDLTYKKAKSYLAEVPYSLNLKTLCWKIGQSFVKVSNKPDSLYGNLYRERKAFETSNNEKGLYVKEANKYLNLMNWDKSKEAYKAYVEGHLPKSHIDARSRRWVVKLFISHLFEAMYLDYYHKPAPKPYILAYNKEHYDYIPPEVPFDRFIKI